MADLNNTIVRGKLRVTDEIVGPLNIKNLSPGTNDQFLSVSNGVPTWVDRPGIKPWYSTTGSSKYNNGTAAPSVGSDSPNINARSTTTGRYYAVEVDANGRAYVNVPRSDTTHYLYRYDITVSGATSSNNLDTVITFNVISTTYYPLATWTYVNLVNRLSNWGYNSDTTICAANGIKVSNYYAPQGSAHVLGVYSDSSGLCCVYAETATSGGTLTVNSISFNGTPTVSVVVNGPLTV